MFVSYGAFWRIILKPHECWVFLNIPSQWLTISIIRLPAEPALTSAEYVPFASEETSNVAEPALLLTVCEAMTEPVALTICTVTEREKLGIPEKLMTTVLEAGFGAALTLTADDDEDEEEDGELGV